MIFSMVRPEMLSLPLAKTMVKICRVPETMPRVEEELVEVVTFVIPVGENAFEHEDTFLLLDPCEG